MTVLCNTGSALWSSYLGNSLYQYVFYPTSTPTIPPTRTSTRSSTRYPTYVLG